MNILRKKGFSLAEMMVVILVLSIVLAASMPIITKRTTSAGSDSIWNYTTNGKDIFYGTDGAHRVSIGKKAIPGITPNSDAMLTLNSKDLTQSQMSFSQNGTYSGKLVVDGNNNTGLGNGISFSPSAGTYTTNSVAIGLGSGAIGNQSVAIGRSTGASGDCSVATGTGAQATGQFDSAMGFQAIANQQSSISFGENSHALGN